ncbi:MAG: hypothetical protein HYZ91_01795, partial [Candidatus Omnitrophica bacterium]|nr:hypothetical protein [Candidatus Omnitrophota bacterium]
MHIALIAEDLPLPEYGGAGILLEGMVHHLQQAGHRTTLLWLPSVYRRDVTDHQRQGLAALGVGLIRLEFPQGPASGRSLRDRLRYAFRPSVSDFYPAVALGPEVERQITQVEADVILAFDVPAVTASRGITRVPRLAAVGTWAHRFRYARWRAMPFQWTLSYLKYSVWVFTSLLQAKRMIALLAECQASGHFAANFAQW